MTKIKTDQRSTPVDQGLDPEVIPFRQQLDQCSRLDELVRAGARKLLQEAIDAEVEFFVNINRHRWNKNGRRVVVKNRSFPALLALTWGLKLLIVVSSASRSWPEKFRYAFGPARVNEPQDAYNCRARLFTGSGNGLLVLSQRNSAVPSLWHPRATKRQFGNQVYCNPRIHELGFSGMR